MYPLHLRLLTVLDVFHGTLCDLLSNLSINHIDATATVGGTALAQVLTAVQRSRNLSRYVRSLAYPVNKLKIFESTDVIKVTIDIKSLDITIIIDILTSVNGYPSCKNDFVNCMSAGKFCYTNCAACDILKLRKAIADINRLRNFTSHATPTDFIELESGSLSSAELPPCKDWRDVCSMVSDALENCLNYLCNGAYLRMPLSASYKNERQASMDRALINPNENEEPVTRQRNSYNIPKEMWLKHSSHSEKADNFVEELSQGTNNGIYRLNTGTWFIMDYDERYTLGHGCDNTEVFIGYQESIDNGWVAVKRCLKDKSKKHDDAIQEIEILKQFGWGSEHQHIIKFLHSVNDDRDWYYVIMELCEQTLKDYMNGSPELSFKQRSDLSFEFLEGLSSLHAINVAHRDLKPSNLLLSRNGKIKIADFGISRFFDPSKTYTTVNQGTSIWISPDKVCKLGQRGKVDIADDRFVAIMVLFYIFTGEHPFCDSEHDDVQKIAQGHIRSGLLDSNLMGYKFKEMFQCWENDKNSFTVDCIRVKLSEAIELHRRTPGQRYAILLSNSSIEWSDIELKQLTDQITILSIETANPPQLTEILRPTTHIKHLKEKRRLDSSRPDVTLLKYVFEKCGFHVKVRDDASRVELSQLINEIKRTIIESEREENEDVYVYLHISGHAHYDINAKDTIVHLRGLEQQYEHVPVKDIIREIFSIQININSTVKLILTADVCREEIASGRAEIDCPSHPMIIAYSVKRGSVSADNTGLPEAFSTPFYFCRGLANNIRPGRNLRDVFNDVHNTLDSETAGWFGVNVDQVTDDSLYDFVL